MYDMRNALRELSIETYTMIRMHYEDTWTLEQIGAYFNVDKSTVSRKINTAIKKMSKELGGDNPWV